MKLRSGQNGFTLVEAMISLLLMVGVMFALYAIFDAGIKVIVAGTDETEAVETARLGMERMEREIRAAHPFDPASGKSYLFFDRTTLVATQPQPESITFGNDLDGNGKIECPLAPASADRCEYFTYDLYKPTGENKEALAKRRRGNRQAIVGNIEELKFEYLEEDGQTVAVNEEDISVVRITLEVAAGDQSQELTTSVALRGRAG